MKKQTVVFWLMLLGVCLAAMLIQQQLFLNWDVSYLLQAAERLRAGGRYTHEFFTPNPPLIFYLYMPPLLLKQALGFPLVQTVRVYIFLWASLSFALCAFFARRLFLQEPRAVFLRQVFLLTLAIIFLGVPSYDFGQREHLLLMASMPYLLLLACRLQAVPIARRWAGGVGLLAGVGFALKPQFYLLFALLEGFVTWRRPRGHRLLRCETLTIIGFLLFYIFFLLRAYPDYVGVVLPYVLRHFYNSVGEPASRLLFNHLALFCCLPLFLSGVLYKKNPSPALTQILVLAVLGFLGCYLAQHTLFYYHILPAFSVAILLQVLLFAMYITQPRYSPADYLAALATALLSFALLFSQVRSLVLTLLFATPAFFGFFGALFAFLLVAMPKKYNLFRVAVSLACILLVGFVCSYLAGHTVWSRWQFSLTVSVLLAMFGLLAPRERGGVGSAILTAALGMLLFAYPVFFSYCLYWRGVEYKEKILDKLIVFTQAQAPQASLYVFSLRGNYGAPLVHYIDGHLAQRFDCLWPAAAFIRQPALTAALQKDKNFFIEMIADDLRQGKPDLVFVDKRDTKMQLWSPGFSYLAFLSQNPRFREEWRNYRYLTTLRDHFLYELEVYKRSKG